MTFNGFVSMMTTFPTIKTERLLLTQLNFDHLPALVELSNNKNIARQITNMPYPFTDIHASLRLGYVTQGYKENSRYCFVILMKNTMELIGEISLHKRDNENQIAELGYWIGEPFWNKGFASEATSAILDFGFHTCRFKTIYATCRKENIASQKVLRKNKMSIIERKPNQLVYGQNAIEFV